ncbi:MAG: SCO family protein [Bacteroidales bacterium]|nr:SCO family protein [Bacteroidales bacterium]
MNRFVLLLVFFLISIEGKSLYNNRNYGINEFTGKKINDVYNLTDENSETSLLTEIIDKPTLISFVYYNCPDQCNRMLDGIAEIIDLSDLKLGEDYQVFTISIDHNDTPDIARKKKENYIKGANKQRKEKYWKFFTTDSLTIDNLTKETGWYFWHQKNVFIHPLVTILITPENKISQYFYGTFFLPMHYKMAVEDARQEKVAPSRIKTLKYCINSDIPKNRYTTIFLMSSGLLILISVIVVFWLMFRPQHKRESHD